jgi:hypothetical protein
MSVCANIELSELHVRLEEIRQFACVDGLVGWEG